MPRKKQTTARSGTRTPRTDRSNQRRRTRKDLLAAAARLLKAGQTPDMDAVAAEALVSRATAYRYFPSVEALLLEAPLDREVTGPEELFRNDGSMDPVERVEKAETMLHDMVYRNAAQLRLMLAASLDQKAKAPSGDATPVRQNRRTALIEAALKPARKTFSDAAYRKLCASLALVFGIESMVVFSDVLGMDEKAARRIKSWAIQALIEAARNESAGK